MVCTRVHVRWGLVLAAGLVACGVSEDTDALDDGSVVAPADPVTPSGACPAFDSTGRSSIESNGKTRNFEIYFPADRPANMPVVFAWHGLSDLGSDPAGSTVRGFGLDALADEEGAVVIAPEALPTSLVGIEVALWGILDNGEDDLALYDDLRACLKQELDVDLSRVGSWGHSGGGLWTSKLIMDRGDTLAAAVSSSGGIELEIIAGEFLEYTTPAYTVPSLLIAGGDGDVWPDASFPIIVFEESTDNLEAGLSADGHLVGRCGHDLGHNQLPPWYRREVVAWLVSHRYGEPSPYAGDAPSESLPAAACSIVSEPAR